MRRMLAGALAVLVLYAAPAWAASLRLNVTQPWRDDAATATSPVAGCDLGSTVDLVAAWEDTHDRYVTGAVQFFDTDHCVGFAVEVTLLDSAGHPVSVCDRRVVRDDPSGQSLPCKALVDVQAVDAYAVLVDWPAPGSQLTQTGPELVDESPPEDESGGKGCRGEESGEDHDRGCGNDGRDHPNGQGRGNK